ncbi:MAG TPA: ATP-binding protein [Phycisphaerae bacterium]|nr:ATP-binding protein [Phycisphaerae bacterium]
MYPRNVSARVLEALGDSPVVFLHGARQTGKSTLVQHLVSTDHPARYITFDDPTALGAAAADPTGFVAGLDGPIALDEVQRVPDILLAIKSEVDRNRRPGRFLLTGSANVFMLPRVADCLAGRMEILTLWPLSQGELLGRREGFIDALFARSLPDAAPGGAPQAGLVGRLLQGGYPEGCARKDAARRRAWFSSYIATILQRDVRDLADIGRLTAMPRLLALLASRVGSLVNCAEMSRSLQIPQTSLKRYLALLEATFLLCFLPPWTSNLGKRLIKSPKLYLNDTGLAASLLGCGSRRALEASGLIGPLVENFVVMELRKQAAWSKSQPGLFHFRTLPGQEVDIVLESPSGSVVGIEVKASASVRAADAKGLHALADAAGPRFVRGIVLYSGDEVVPFGKRLHAVPYGALWQW